MAANIPHRLSPSSAKNVLVVPGLGKRAFVTLARFEVILSAQSHSYSVLGTRLVALELAGAEMEWCLTAKSGLWPSPARCTGDLSTSRQM